MAQSQITPPPVPPEADPDPQASPTNADNTDTISGGMSSQTADYNYVITAALLFILILVTIILRWYIILEHR